MTPEKFLRQFDAGDPLLPGWRDAAVATAERLRLKLAATGFAQVIFVAANTVFIAHYALMANLLTAFAISWVWSFNVKKIAFGTNADRWAYAIGAACGSLVGNVLATHLVRWLA